MPRASARCQGPESFAQEVFDVRRLVELDTHAGQRLAVGAEVERLGVNQNAVVVEQDRFEHLGIREVGRRLGRLDVLELSQIEQQVTILRFTENVSHPIPPEDFWRAK